MSAWLVSKKHIDIIITAALFANRGNTFRWYFEGKWRELRLDNADEIGQMLINQNADSVGTKYESTLSTELPGDVDNAILPYHYARPAGDVTAIQTIKLINSYQYQASETSDRLKTEAYEFTQRLKETLITMLKGYDEAPWQVNPRRNRK